MQHKASAQHIFCLGAEENTAFIVSDMRHFTRRLTQSIEATLGGIDFENICLKCHASPKSDVWDGRLSKNTSKPSIFKTFMKTKIMPALIAPVFLISLIVQRHWPSLGIA